MIFFRLMTTAALLLTLGACAYPRTGYFDGVPYEHERTAGRGIH